MEKNTELRRLSRKELKEKRRKTISRKSFIVKIGIYLWIYKVWHIQRSNSEFTLECNQYNAYNPLFWVFVLCLIPISMCNGVIVLFQDIVKMCTISRWG